MMEAGATTPLHQVLAAGRRRLLDSGVSAAEAALDVDLFARAILGWDQAQLVTERALPAPERLEPRFSAFLDRRARREPTAYILGTREFWGLDFLVTPAVLIPRPETEFIVEESLRVAADTGLAGGPALLADIGTGCGCIAVTLARELPACRMVATDVSPAALDVARENARRHGVGDRTRLVATSYLDGVSGTFDLIAANPPYVREGDRMALSQEVRYEPDVALFGGASGLRNIEGVLDLAAARLRRGGYLIMEFGFGQEDEVRALAQSRAHLRVERVHEDLQGLPRTAVVQRLA